ncbi:Mpo1-like protein [Aquirhabdus sp.]|uniref:Mpo1-like protein n=1 Tax=Aquirhabdus sp. TaxID=2824160 RepID=UPI00396C5A5F
MSDVQNVASGKQVMPIKDYEQFYKFYLTEHSNSTSRKLHFAGSTFGLIGLGVAVKKGKLRYALMGITAGYACAWVGHFIFERNKPASFKQPLYSFISDFRMYSDVLRGRISLKGPEFDKK